MERLKEEAGRRAGIAQRKQLQEEEQKRLKRLEAVSYTHLGSVHPLPEACGAGSHFRHDGYKNDTPPCGNLAFCGHGAVRCV